MTGLCYNISTTESTYMGQYREYLSVAARVSSSFIIIIDVNIAPQTGTFYRKRTHSIEREHISNLRASLKHQRGGTLIPIIQESPPAILRVSWFRGRRQTGRGGGWRARVSAATFSISVGRMM